MTLPSFLIQVQELHSKFHHVISNAMDRDIVFHLGNCPKGNKAIKLVHIHFRKVVT